MPENTDIQFNKLHEIYRQNITSGMVKYLADELHVSTEALVTLGVGYNYAQGAFTFPERDTEGNIIGLSHRYVNGKKACESGSKRGLIYALNPSYLSGKKKYESGSHNWYKLQKGNGISCPICGHDNWCMVSAVSPENPPAVCCGRVQQNSVAELGMGWLHILRPEGDLRQANQTILSGSDYPVLIVEGLSDVAAAYDLGLIAVGRPAASAGLKLLQNLPLAGRELIVVGEHDSGAGAVGMEQAFRVLRNVTPHIRKVMPPEGIKDFREWKNTGLTLGQFIQYADSNSDALMKGDVFDDDAAPTIAKAWIQTQIIDGLPSIRLYQGDWVQFQGNHYVKKDEDVLRGELYAYLDGKFYQNKTQNGGVEIKQFKASRSKVNDVFDALNQWCPIQQSPPLWLVGGKAHRPQDIIVFKNGFLDVNDFCDGKIKLHKPTTEYFTLNALPYNFDENARSKDWEQFLTGIFDDAEQVQLLAEWMGYLLVPDISYEKLMVLTGLPRSGKGTIMDATRAMLGHEQCAETSFQSLIGSFGYQPLIGKLAAFIGDAKSPKATESDSALEKILQITGGDPVTANKKYVSQLPTVQLYCRFTFAMNDLPAFSDFARALEARLLMLSFVHSYVGKEDRSLKYRLKADAAAGKLIMFALKGLKRLREQGQFTEPESSKDLLNGYRDVSVPTISFANECLDIEPDPNKWSPGMWAELGQIYDVWAGWCKDRGQRIGGRAQFTRWFQQAFPTVANQRRRIQTERFYGFAGVMIRPSALQRYVKGR